MTPHQGEPQPPRGWTWLLRWTLPRSDRDWQGRELAELYRMRVRQLGRPAAHRWYRAEVLRFLAETSRLRLARFMTRPSFQHSQGGMRDISSDLRFALRSLIRNPGFAAVAILTLTLGIGANTILFSVVDHVLFRPLPYPNPGELVSIWPNAGMLQGELFIIQRDSRSFVDVGGYRVPDGFNLTIGSGSRRVQGSAVMPGVLRILGVAPVLGRTFAEDETQPGNDGVVLITDHLWAGEYGRADVIGRTIELDGRPRTVIGVLPSLTFPDAGQDVLIPLVMDPTNQGLFWGWGGFHAIARLAPGITPAVAQDELRGLASVMRESNTLWTPVEDFRSQTVVLPLQDQIVGDTSVMLYVLLGAVGLMLLVACLNVANLLLGRGLARRRDVALRTALGASRRRIVREQLVESLVISAIGFIVALVASHWALQALVAMLPPEIPRVGEITLDVRVGLVGLASALAAGLVAGSLPAARGARTDPAATLREHSGRSANRRRLSNAMVIAQITLAVPLLTGAGLLIRSLSALNGVERGFDGEGIVTARLNLAGDQFDDPEDRSRFFEEVVAQVRSLPGVQSAAVGSRVPFGASRGGVATFIEGVTQDPNALPVLYQTSISPDYLRTLGIPLVDGRGFTAADREGSALVALVDETAARRFWPNESPVGRRIRYPWQGAPWIEVVGVVGGVADRDLASARDPGFYQPIAQRPPGAATVVIKTATAQVGLIDGMRSAVGRVNASVPVSRVATLNSLVGESMAQTRWTTVLLALFAGVTLLLGGVGVYGVVAYSVRARTQEIGVRMALGADASRIRAAVVRDGAKLVAPGLVAGLLLAVPGGRLLEGLLFGVTTFDLPTFASIPVVLAVAAWLAVYVPARRATGVHPVDALREN